MKVLLISVWKPRIGGIVTRVENIIKRSKQAFLILTYKDKNAFDEEANVIRVPYLNLPLLRGVTFAIFSFFKGIRCEFDVIHAHYAVPQGLVGALIKKIRKKPLILTVHGSDLTVLGRSFLIRPVLKWILNSADKVIAVSVYMKNLIVQMGIDEEKVRVIYNGVSKHSMAKGREKRVIFIGALKSQKGADILIKAFGEVKKKHAPAKLLIVGDGPERKALEEYVKENRFADVEFRGYLKDINPVFTARSILVLPSREEGFGIVVLEAMSRGVPVVASRTGGVREIIKDTENGLLFEKENHIELADRVIKIFDDDELRKRLKEGGLKTVERFTWEKTAEEIEDVYENI